MRRFWYPRTGKIHSDPSCMAARRYKADLIEWEDGRCPQAKVNCKRCLKRDEAELVAMADCESIKPAPATRCNRYGDLPDGRHITELEDAELSPAELQMKRAAFAEGHDDDAAGYGTGFEQ